MGTRPGGTRLIKRITDMENHNNKPYGINLENLDKSVSPKEDFYDYATGGWRKLNPLRPEYARFAVFDKLALESKEKLRNLVDNISRNPESEVKGTNAQKVRDLHGLALDMDRRNREGTEPIKRYLERVENEPHPESAIFQALMVTEGTPALAILGVGPDPEDSENNIVHISSCGTTLGDRDFYLVENEYNSRIIEAFKVYTNRIMTLSGYSDREATRIWDAVIEIETEIARHQRTREERRNPELSCNIRSFDQLCKEFPEFDWKLFFEKTDVPTSGRINVGHPEFITFITGYLKSLPERKLKDYLLFSEVSEATSLLSEDFEKADFEFSKVISGVEEERPRWRKALSLVESMLGEPLGILYVEAYFPEESKRHTLELVENLRKSLREHILKLTWMSDATKLQALEKLERMSVKIGYPDKWRDYSGIIIDPSLPLAENCRESSRWWVRYGLDKAGKPVDHTEWFMTPQTVNAYYSPRMNEICFPAAILQPPFFDINADDALNYGGIGAVIGHEMTHGFDDSGRKFDKDGNLHEWWTPEDEKRFNALADQLVAQFDAIEVAPCVHANGRFTLGENIADQGGVRIALTAYLDSESGRKAVTDGNGMTPLTRFFLSYGGVWGGNIRPEAIRERTQTDPHSLGRYRVNATLRNIEEFFETFGIREGDGMWRPQEERVIIW